MCLDSVHSPQIRLKSFVGEVYLCTVGRDMDRVKGRGKKKQSQGNRKKIHHRLPEPSELKKKKKKKKKKGKKAAVRINKQQYKRHKDQSQ